MKKVLIIGGGAAGMLAAIFAAQNQNEVHVFEKNEKLGKKLYITGKGRCNITNASDMDTLFGAIMTNPKFMYSSLYGFTNEDAIHFFESIGVATKIERGNRVFPVSDHSSDVINAMIREMKRLKVTIHYNATVKSIQKNEEGFTHLELVGGNIVSGDICIVATGGASYQATGSTGDGYRFAESLGHSVSKKYPSLVPLVIKEEFVKELQGLSLRNVAITICDDKRQLYHEFGEMLFTHYGVSGPLILSSSSYITKIIQNKELQLTIDLKPALSIEQLDQRVLRDFEGQSNKQFRNALSKLFPAKLIPVIIKLSSIDENKKVHEISKEERIALVQLIKNVPLTIIATRSFNEAIITKGGINVKELQPATMESKIMKGLYFVGEVIDVDALTGGYNLQIAWSTAYAAANSII